VGIYYLRKSLPAEAEAGDAPPATGQKSARASGEKKATSKKKKKGKTRGNEASNAKEGKASRVKLARMEIQGSMNRDATRRILIRGARCIDAGYEIIMGQGPGSGEGRSSWCLKISSMGRVRAVNIVASTVGDSTLTKHMKRCLKRLRFPPPEGGGAEVCGTYILYSD